MKENSIEAYVKILEKFSNENVIYGSTVGMTLEKYKDLQLSTEHILSDYKRVLKENERYQKSDYEAICLENNELSETIDRIQSEYNDLLKENKELKKSKITYEKVRDIQEKNKNIVDKKYISKQKVREKIEEMQKEYNKLDKQIDEYINDVNKDLAKYYENKEKISIMQTLSCFIDTLQELLEGRK